MHCIGMCGPISLVMFSDRHGPLSYLTYQVSRLFGYLFFSSLVFLIGKPFQKWVSPKYLLIFFVVLMLILTIPSISKKLSSKLPQLQSKLSIKLMPWLGKSAFPIIIGFFSGLLPCGLLYVAYGSTIAFGSLFEVWPSIAVFFLGTFPTLLIGQLLGHRILHFIPSWTKTLLTVLLFGSSVLMLYRHLSMH